MRRLGLVVLLVFCAACGDDVQQAAPAPRPVAPKGTPLAALAPPKHRTREQVLEEVRKQQLTNDDFVESATNRDPFRSYLSTFAAQVVVAPQHKIILDKFSLDELKLIAIVSGEGAAPEAMFVDPTGLGVTVVRGDHVSKADATVTRIAPDRVFFQIGEDEGDGKTKPTERVIALHAGEVQPE